MNPHDRIDDYVDGALDPQELAAFEQAMHRDPALRAQVAELASLRADLAELRTEAPPSRDLWPEIGGQLDDAPANRPWLWPTVLGAGGLIAVAVVLALAIGVGVATQLPVVVELTSPSAVHVDRVAGMERLPTEGPLATGYAALRDGDLPRAHAAFETVAAARPHDPEALIAASYTRMLQGDHDGADALLVQAQDHVPDAFMGSIHIRRAIVALQRDDLDAVQRHGEASGLPAGLVFAAEVYLVDAEADAAVPLLQRAARSDDPRVAQTARDYLEALGDRESGRQQLAEATAMWSLRQRADAVEVAEELLRFLPVELAERDRLLLLWAGRAAASGRPDVAESLLDEMSGVPHHQAWRVQATRALVLVGRGEVDQAEEIFRALAQGGAPADGLRDALLTAALIAQDPADKRRLLAGLDGAPEAYILRDPGRVGYDDGPLGRFVQSL